MLTHSHPLDTTLSLSTYPTAQTLWDEYMAESASNYIKDSGAGSRMVLMAGSNHIQNRYGVPDRITRRLGVPVFTVVPISVPFDAVSGLPAIDDEGLGEILVPSYADWLYFVEREPEDEGRARAKGRAAARKA